MLESAPGADRPWRRRLIRAKESNLKGIGLKLAQSMYGIRSGLQRLSYVIHPELNGLANLLGLRTQVQRIANVFYVSLHTLKGADDTHLRRLTPEGKKSFIRNGKRNGHFPMHLAGGPREVVYQCAK
jgi:hypothetical protein